MKYASRGASQEDQVQAPEPMGPFLDEDLPHEPHHAWTAGPGGGDAAALLPWVDDIGPTVAPTAPVQGPPADPGKLKLDLKKKELRAGNPDDPNAGYFLASAKEQGARWRTSDGDFTGKVNKDGLDTRIKLDEDDQLHGTVDAKKKEGALAWERDGKNQGELYGKYESGNDWEGGVRKAWDLEDGKLNTGLRYQQTDQGGLTGIYGDYKSTDGKTALDGTAGVRNGGFVGGLSGSHAWSDTRKIKGSVAHDEDGTTAKLGGQYDNFTLDGNYKRTDAGDSYGLNGSYKLGDKGAINGGWNHSKDGDAFKLDGNYKFNDHNSMTGSLTHDKNATVGKLGGEHTWDGGSLSGSAEVANRANGTTTTLAGAYRNKGLSLDGTYVNGPDDDALSLNGKYKFNDNTSMNGSFKRDKNGNTFSLGADHKWGDKGNISGSYEHTPTTDKLNLSGAYTPNDRQSYTGSFGLENGPTGTQATLGLSERYKSPNLIHSLGVDAGLGTQNYVGMNGAIDGRLGKNLYAGAWGNARYEEGKQFTGQVGGSMTYMMNDKNALTAAALMNDKGQLEARLEYDMFKKSVADTQGLVDARKDPRLSLFLSYAQGGKRSMDDRFGGAPMMEMGNKGNTISGGIKLSF